MLRYLIEYINITQGDHDIYRYISPHFNLLNTSNQKPLGNLKTRQEPTGSQLSIFFEINYVGLRPHA